MEELMNLRNLSRFLLLPITLSLLGGQTIVAVDTPAQPPIGYVAPQPKPASAQRPAQNPWITYGLPVAAFGGMLAYGWYKKRPGSEQRRKKHAPRPEMPKF